MEHPEDDPTALEPEETEDMEEPDPPEPMGADAAAHDPTVDDAEHDLGPSDG